MAKQKVNIGGFVALNSGNIDNSYSVLRINGKDKLAGGFVCENSGAIAKSYYCGRVKNLGGGFVTTDKGDTEINCYFLHTEKEGSKVLQRLPDSIKAQKVAQIKDNDTLVALGFDIESIWQYRGNEIPMGFIPDKWIYTYENKESEPLTIETADELTAWATKVNEGDKQARNAHVVLAADISLGDKEWVPVGESRVNTFDGVFDGKGHTINSFVINDKKRENKGFFGFLKGQVYNLSVDCTIKKGSCIGGLVAQNEGGTIGCCSAVVEIKANQGCIGGLVGRNTGKVFASYSAGTIITIAVIPLWWGLPLLALLFLLFLIKPEGLLPTFAPVPYDKDQIPIQGETLTPNTDGNFVSFQFQQEIDIALNTGNCKFEFKNPGNSNHNIVVQLQFTDAQAIRVMGSTGRSQKEQDKLESTPGYDPENYRTIIAESGAIRPGNMLEDLRLVTHANGATLPVGDYNAMVYLVFYDIGTNNRAMLESQLPVVISVKLFN